MHVENKCKFKSESLPEWYHTYLKSRKAEFEIADEKAALLDVNQQDALLQLQNQDQPLAMRMFKKNKDNHYQLKLILEGKSPSLEVPAQNKAKDDEDPMLFLIGK